MFLSLGQIRVFLSLVKIEQETTYPRATGSSTFDSCISEACSTLTAINVHFNDAKKQLLYAKERRGYSTFQPFVSHPSSPLSVCDILHTQNRIVTHVASKYCVSESETLSPTPNHDGISDFGVIEN